MFSCVGSEIHIDSNQVTSEHSVFDLQVQPSSALWCLLPGHERGGHIESLSPHFPYGRASLVAKLVRNPPATQETWVPSLGWGNSLEKGKATHSSILAWRIPWTVQSMGSQRVGQD